jgi:hypothetical protein
MDYNLGSRKNCLVGNWSEELALNEYAGHYRMPHDGAKGTSTYKRCVEHSLRYDVADLATTNRKDFNEPTAPHQNLTYKPNASVGAREQLMMQKLKAVAAAKQPPAEQPREWDTIAQSSYQWPEVDEHYRTEEDAVTGQRAAAGARPHLPAGAPHRRSAPVPRDRRRQGRR